MRSAAVSSVMGLSSFRRGPTLRLGVKFAWRAVRDQVQ